MSFCLDNSGLFYADRSFVKVSEKPVGVRAYGIYAEIDPPKLILTERKVYDMRRAKILEVITDGLERIFFEYDSKGFHRTNPKTIDIMEGEHELMKHLGLLGLARAKHYDEISIE